MLVTGGELPTVGLNLRSAGRKCFEDSRANHVWCPENDEVVTVEADVLQVVDCPLPLVLGNQLVVSSDEHRARGGLPGGGGLGLCRFPADWAARLTRSWTRLA